MFYLCIFVSSLTTVPAFVKSVLGCLGISTVNSVLRTSSQYMSLSCMTATCGIFRMGYTITCVRADFWLFYWSFHPSKPFLVWDRYCPQTFGFLEKILPLGSFIPDALGKAAKLWDVLLRKISKSSTLFVQAKKKSIFLLSPFPF